MSLDPPLDLPGALPEEEKKRVQDLLSEAESWKRSQLIREYVSAVRGAAVKKRGEIASGSEIDQWLTWASHIVDRFDPLVPKVILKAPDQRK